MNWDPNLALTLLFTAVSQVSQPAVGRKTAWMTPGASSVPTKRGSALGMESEMCVLPTITS